MKPCAALILLLAACGGAGSLTLDQFSAAQATASAQAATCQDGVAPALVPQVERDDANLQKAIAAKRMSFDGVRAKACADDLLRPFNACWGADAPQRGPAGLPDDCQRVFLGLVPDGAACYTSPECASGECTFNKGACPGVCAATLPTGADCTGAGACARGLVCAQTSGTCQPPGARGVACADSSECQPGLRCAQGTCAVPLAANAACAPPSGGEDPCADGYYCPGNTCQPRVDTGVACTTPASPRQLQSRQCKGNQMCIGATADAKGNLLTPGRCGAPQDVGGPCVRPPQGVNSPQSVGCYLGLVCDPGTSRCALPPKAGARCIDNQCNGGAYCSNGNCVAALADGAACTSSVQCQAGHGCAGGVCSAPPVRVTCAEP